MSNGTYGRVGVGIGGVAALAVLILSAGAARAVDGHAAAVRALLGDSWSARLSPSARAELDAVYDDARPVTDARVEQAYGLALMRQYRFPDALAAMKRATELAPSDLDAHRGRIWLEISNKAYGSALAELERAATLIPAEPPADPAEAERLTNFIRFLGRAVGFLEGPVGNDASSTQLRRVQGALNQQFSQSQLAQFEAARQQVLDEYSRFLEEIESAERTNQQEQTELKEDQLEQLDEERERADARRDELSQKQAKLREELQSELNDIANRDAPLRDRLARLEVQALPIRRELALLGNEIARLESRLQDTEDPFLRDSLIREINRLSFLGRRYSGDLSLLESEARRIGGERAALAMRQQQAQSVVGGEFNRAAKEITDLSRVDKKRAIQEKRLLRSRAGMSRQARALAAKAVVLATYDPYPLEEKRRLLLDSVQ